MIDLEFLLNNYVKIKYNDDKNYYDHYISILMKNFIKDIIEYQDGWIMRHSCINKLEKYFKINYLNEYVPPAYMAVGKEMKLQPYEYQKEAIYYGVQNKNALLVLPCGSGKTPIGIGIYLEAKKLGLVNTAGLIVVKASLKKQWVNEVSKFSDLSSSIIQTYSARCQKYVKAIKKCKDPEQAKEIQKQADIYFKEQFENIDLLVCNYETLNDNKVLDALLEKQLDYIMCDEIHYIKNHKSDRAKALYHLNNAKIKIGATATPITKDPRDVYGIYKFICPDLFGKVGEFQKQYIKFAGYGRINGFKNQIELKEKISNNIFVKTKEEISSQLPSLIVNKIYIDLNDDQLTLHQELMDKLDELNHKDFVIRQTCKSEFEANSNAELQQINGQIMAIQTFAQELTDCPSLLSDSDSDYAKQFGEKVSIKYNPKMDICIELIDQIIESGEKVCIFSKFERMQGILTKAIESNFKSQGIKISYVNGSLSAERRYEEAYTKFRDNDDYKILLCSDAGAEGLNLPKCKYLIEYDLANSYAIQTQRQGRVERADSVHDNVICYQLIANDSWDTIQEKIINKKQKFDENIIKDLRN